jgi:hypothetical protein
MANASQYIYWSEIRAGAEVGAHEVVGAEGGPSAGTEDPRAVDIVHVDRDAQDAGQADEVRADVAVALSFAPGDRTIKEVSITELKTKLVGGDFQHAPAPRVG